MTSQPRSEKGMAIDRRRFAAMIDQLVAVQMDLKPLRGNADGALVGGQNQAVTEACAVLQSAIDDLKQVIFELEDFPGAGSSAPPSAEGRGSR